MIKRIKGTIKSPTEKGVYEAIASTANIDRDGESIDAKSWQLDEFKKNPVLLFGHQHHEAPIGRVMDIVATGKELLCKFVFATTERAKEFQKLVDERILNALSVGFMSEKKDGNTLVNNKLLEISLVTVPSNPEAMILARSKGLNTKILEEGEVSEEYKLIDEVSKNLNKRLTLLEKQLEEPKVKLAKKEIGSTKSKEVSKPKLEDNLVLERTLQILATYTNKSLENIKKLRKDNK